MKEISVRRPRPPNSLRRQIFSAGSACVKKTKWRISAVVFEIFFFSPVLKSPTHIGFIGVKKMGQKSHTWAPLSLNAIKNLFNSNLSMALDSPFYLTSFYAKS